MEYKINGDLVRINGSIYRETPLFVPTLNPLEWNGTTVVVNYLTYRNRFKLPQRQSTRSEIKSLLLSLSQNTNTIHENKTLNKK